MASEEPRPCPNIVDARGKRASSAASECSSFSVNMAEDKEMGKNVSAVNKNPSLPSDDDHLHQSSPSVPNSNQPTTVHQGNASNSVAISPTSKRPQPVEPAPEVKSEPATPDSTALSCVPSCSPKIQLGHDADQKESSNLTGLSPATGQEISRSSESSHLAPMKEFSLEYVRNVARSNNIEELKAGAELGLDVLRELHAPLKDAKQLDLLDTIEHLAQKGKPTRTIVAVAGATGAGKSSLINAVLDEEKLLPTNGMRACTAVITEVSYNYDKDITKPYRAEVEFIPRDDWSSELDILFEELVNGNQLSSSYRDSTTEAGIAYAKIRAVYPDLTHEMLVRSNRRQLEGRPAVRDLLGTTKKMLFKKADELYATLQKYLDSTEKKGRKSNTEKGTIALWPLIKVVRIFCRADALSTGLCIIDLPGIHDSNAARSAVAKRYMAECSAVWLASPIKRAVDDKAAKELLGQSSRTQFKMDGTYSNVTFICTCSDAFEVSEIQDQLDSDGRIEDSQQGKTELSAAIAEKPAEINDLEKRLEEAQSHLLTLEDMSEIWEEISDQHERGQQVYAPTSNNPSRKRRRRTAKRSEGGPASNEAPLTGEEITSKLEDLGRQETEKQAAVEELKERLENARFTLAQMERDEAELSTAILKLCMDRRNEWCKDAIRLDFVAGIREQDEEAQQQGDATSDSSAVYRDYDEVARRLPVFTISSKAYQQFRATDKRLRTETKGFTSPEETEIPALQAHAKNMTQTGQIMAYKTFLNNLIQLLGTLQIFANNSDREILQSSQVGEHERTYEIKVLESEVHNLKQLVKHDILELKKALLGILRQGTNARSANAAIFAAKKIEDVIVSWHTKEDEHVGHYKGLGLSWSTYKASCRRKGGKTVHPRSKDFNEEILAPFLTKLSTSWEHTFVRDIPACLEKFEDVCRLSLKVFHERAVKRPALATTRTTSLRMLEQQLPDHQATIHDAVRVAKTEVQSEQRQASRLFLPEVKCQMERAYTQCAQVTGGGSYLRMREIMLLHVQSRKESIYRDSYAAVMTNIEGFVDAVLEKLKGKTYKICNAMHRNYAAVISCGQMIEASVVARKHLREVLAGVDARFKSISDDRRAKGIDNAAGVAQSVITDADTSSSKLDDTAQEQQAMDIVPPAVASQPNVTEPGPSKGKDLSTEEPMDIDPVEVNTPEEGSDTSTVTPLNGASDP